LLVVVAAGSLVTLRLRGVGSSAGAVWSDVVVLAAPVLVALALTIMMVRAQPRLLSVARSVAARAHGAVPLLAAARMRASGIATAALVTAGVVAALASSLAITVSHAQVDAAWDAVGGDVAIATDAQGGLPGAIWELDRTNGLTVATATLVAGAQVIGTKIDDNVDIAIVDADAMTRLLAETPLTDAPTLHSLTNTAAKDGSLPVLVTGSAQSWEGVTLRWGDDSVRVTSAGTAPQLPRQLASGRVLVVVDRAALVAALGHDVPPTQAWVAGPGASQRVDAIIAAAKDSGDVTVVTREGWLAERRDAPVTRGLGWLFVGAGAVAAMLAVLAVVLVAASGSDERTRAIARIRVVGASRSAAHRVAWLEVAIPAAVASAAGLLVGFLLTPILLVALDLESVTGGRGAPSSTIPWWVMALALMLGLVARMSVALATLSHGRERLGALMRVG
jgi:putative ABC transport system permease protein